VFYDTFLLFVNIPLITNHILLKRIFSYLAIGLFVSFIFLEIFLRIFYAEKLKTRIYPLIYKPDSSLGYRYIPNVHGEISIPGIHKKFTINSNGFYGPDFDIQKKNGKYRIAIVGSSEASGIWLNGTDNDFSTYLQNMLNKRNVNAEVINFSMDGKLRDLCNTKLIKEIVIQYKPDMVFLNTHIPFIECNFKRNIYKNYVMIYRGDNESSESWCKAKIDYIEDNKFPIFFYNNLYTVRLLCRYYMSNFNNKNEFNLHVFVNKRIQAPDMRYIPYSVKSTLELLKNVQSDLQSNNGNLVLYSYTKFDTMFNYYVQQIGINPIFLNIPNDKSMSYSEDGHYNEKAQTIIAQRIFEKFIFLDNKIIGVRN